MHKLRLFSFGVKTTRFQVTFICEVKRGNCFLWRFMSCLPLLRNASLVLVISFFTSTYLERIISAVSFVGRKWSVTNTIYRNNNSNNKMSSIPPINIIKVHNIQSPQINLKTYFLSKLKRKESKYKLMITKIFLVKENKQIWKSFLQLYRFQVIWSSCFSDTIEESLKYPVLNSSLFETTPIFENNLTTIF